MKKPFPDVIFELKFSVGQYFSLFIKWAYVPMIFLRPFSIVE